MICEYIACADELLNKQHRHLNHAYDSNTYFPARRNNCRCMSVTVTQIRSMGCQARVIPVYVVAELWDVFEAARGCYGVVTIESVANLMARISII